MQSTTHQHHVVRVNVRDIISQCDIVLLQLLVVLINTSFQGAGVGAVVGGSFLDVIFSRSVQLLLEDRVGVSGFELGLEIAESLGAGVGSTTSVAEVVAVVLTFLPVTAPMGFSEQAQTRV